MPRRVESGNDQLRPVQSNGDSIQQRVVRASTATIGDVA
jgi:hypothetical protein